MSDIKTLTDLNFETELQSFSGTTVVKFGGQFCAPCKILDPILDKLLETAAFRIFKIDSDEYPELSLRYKIKGLPTMLVFRDDQLIDSVIGLEAIKKKLNLL